MNGLNGSSTHCFVVWLRKPLCPTPAAFEADQTIGSQFTEQPPNHLTVQGREDLLEFRHRTALGCPATDVFQEDRLVLFSIQPFLPRVSAGHGGVRVQCGSFADPVRRSEISRQDHVI